MHGFHIYKVSSLGLCTIIMSVIYSLYDDFRWQTVNRQFKWPVWHKFYFKLLFKTAISQRLKFLIICFHFHYKASSLFFCNYQNKISVTQCSAISINSKVFKSCFFLGWGGVAVHWSVFYIIAIDTQIFLFVRWNNIDMSNKSIYIKVI